MKTSIQGEELDGFHIERVPQLMTQRFDRRALSPGVGMRAVWRLYRSGKWDFLEDLGVDVPTARRQLGACCAKYGELLTRAQLRQVRKRVPEFVRASQELRLAYALQFYEKGKKAMAKPDQIFHAETTDENARIVVERNKTQIESAGGTISYAKGYNNVPGVVMVTLPPSPVVLEKDILPAEGLTFKKVRGSMTVAIPADTTEVPNE